MKIQNDDSLSLIPQSASPAFKMQIKSSSPFSKTLGRENAKALLGQVNTDEIEKLFPHESVYISIRKSLKKGCMYCLSLFMKNSRFKEMTKEIEDFPDAKVIKQMVRAFSRAKQID